MYICSTFFIFAPAGNFFVSINHRKINDNLDKRMVMHRGYAIDLSMSCFKAFERYTHNRCKCRALEISVSIVLPPVRTADNHSLNCFINHIKFVPSVRLTVHVMMSTWRVFTFRYIIKSVSLAYYHV